MPSAVNVMLKLSNEFNNGRVFLEAPHNALLIFITTSLKGKWYVRRFDPDTVQNGHIYSTMKEEKVFISSFSVGYAEDFSYGRD